MPLSYDPSAFDDVAKKDVRNLVKKIEWLWVHRQEIHHYPLKANLAGYFKRRLDPYRIIYSYDNDNMIIHLVGTRDEIYQKAPRRLK